ncbi:hypothetical protein CEE44_00820 [Candidatus Woesearchaeota archaeon B3_Woes]|nr:MAG: hypothetical protein CEE44_00820 [Candidatus Woesearchaeota archaeon B3_Woes]
MQQKNLGEFSSHIKQKQEVHNDNGREITLKKIYGDIPLNIEDDAYLSIFRESKRDVHNIALYPCKYIPELPRWAIKNFSKENDIILDPFIGGGTTFIEAKKLKRNCLGIDYNPYARLVSKVKSTSIEENKLRSKYNSLMDNIKNDSSSDLPIPNFRGVDFWFNENVIRGLAKIKKYVNKIEDKDIRDFFLVSFSMAVRKSSYIAPGQMLTARRKDWRNIKQLSENDTIDLFSSFSEKYIEYISEFSKEQNISNFAKIIGNDAREINLPEDIDKVDLIVTSPPYINAMDYIWANRLRVHWLDLVKSDQDRLNLYNYEIGTERIPKKEYSILGQIGIDETDKIIEEIYNAYDSNTQSKLRSRVTYKYFLDMKKHFEEAYKVLKNGGRYCIVIGDNNIRKVFVPTSLFLSKIAESVGFKKEKQFQIILKQRSMNIDRNVSFADKIDYDRMIVLKKE